MDRDDRRKAYQRARHWADFFQHRPDERTRPIYKDMDLVSRALLEEPEHPMTPATPPPRWWIYFVYGVLVTATLTVGISIFG